jgi:hypothetical protein
MRFQQRNKAIYQDACFAAACARRDDQVAIMRGDCLVLLWCVRQGRLPLL